MSCFPVSVSFSCDQNSLGNQSSTGRQKPSEKTLQDICESIAVLVEGKFPIRVTELIANYVYPVISDEKSIRQEEISEKFPKVMQKNLKNYFVHVVNNFAIVSIYFSWLSPYHQHNEKPLSTFLNKASLGSALSKTIDPEENRQVVTFSLKCNHFSLTLETLVNHYYNSDSSDKQLENTKFITPTYYIPPGIGELEDLTQFYISRTKLVNLPRETENLKLLEELRVPNNQLESLPDSLTKLTALKILDVSNNRLKALPKEIGKLTSLKQLSIEKNPLEAFPISFHGLGVKALIVDEKQQALLEKVQSAILKKRGCLISIATYSDEKKA